MASYNDSISGFTGVYFQGLGVFIAPPYQKVSLSRDVLVTDKFRAQFNEWAADFFGYGETLQDGQILTAKHLNSMTMNMATFNTLKAEILKSGHH